MTARIINVGLHCHSTWSYDGSWTLADIARFFAKRGYDAVMMSEHDTGFDPESWPAFKAECAAASVHGCTLFPGIEYSSPDNDIHILTWGIDGFFKEHQPVADILDWTKEQGGVAIFAHPTRRNAWRQFDDAWTPYLRGIELWNRKTDGVAPGGPATDLLKATGLPPTLGIDFHKLKHYWPLSHHIEVGEDWQADIVGAISDGWLDLRVFGKPVLDEKGEANVPVSKAIDSARRALRPIKRLVSRR